MNASSSIGVRNFSIACVFSERQCAAARKGAPCIQAKRPPASATKNAQREHRASAFKVPTSDRVYLFPPLWTLCKHDGGGESP
jgi:hypothetical protein